MLETIWFFLWALLWAIYFVLDGFDLGSGTLMPFIAKNDNEKRVVYNASGPFWDGNEVWLITAGGVTFAAFPLAYATLFSALYAPLLILLFALIFRAVAFEFRNKIDSPAWRKACDICLFLGSFLPALLLGVAFANLFMGIPIDENHVYQGNLLTLLNPYGLAGGITFVLMFCMHGAIWLELKSVGDLHTRAAKVARGIWPIVLAAVVGFLALTAFYTHTFATIAHYPILYIPLLLAVIALIAVPLTLKYGKTLAAWFCSAGFILCLTIAAVFGMYPGIILSSLDPAFSITLFNGGSSSQLTLSIMLGVALTGVPIVLAYQAWVYYTFSHRVTQEELESDHAY